jgi:Leucine-rich repeat (LRR) protein
LKSLDLSNNQFTGVPAEVGQLSKLEVLNLSNNQLTGLPMEIRNLKNLKVLDVSGNNVSQLDLDGIIKKLPATVQVIR